MFFNSLWTYPTASRDAHITIAVSQQYEKGEGVFGRVVPKNSFGAAGFGAWQVGVRWSYLNLIDKAIDGGKVVDMMAGLHWFLNPNMKIQWNYTLAQRDGQQGKGNGHFDGLVSVNVIFSIVPVNANGVL